MFGLLHLLPEMPLPGNIIESGEQAYPSTICFRKNNQAINFCLPFFKGAVDVIIKLCNTAWVTIIKSGKELTDQEIKFVGLFRCEHHIIFRKCMQISSKK
jgi:hypothetical protein